MTTVPTFPFTQPGETWCQTHVDGYFVSDLGRLASHKEPTGSRWSKGWTRLLTLNPGDGGYLRANLRGDFALVQTLVAAAFLPARPSPEHEIEFTNGDGADCRATNLAWSTQQEKIDAQRAAGTWDPSTRNGRPVLTEDDVRALRDDLANGMRNVDAAVKYGIVRSNVCHIKMGRSWSHVV